jgi:REP element-mobilizing transposase RayT
MVNKNHCTDEERFPKRKSPRIPGYDYATPNYYFITICTHEKNCIFWSGGKLNTFGQIAFDAAMQISAHFPGNRVDRFVVMPNHIHMILVVEPGGTDATVVIGQYKSQVSKEIHKIDPKRKIWQTSFHDHGIRNYRQYQHIREYIETNPMRWKEDCFFVE